MFLSNKSPSRNNFLFKGSTWDLIHKTKARNMWAHQKKIIFKGSTSSLLKKTDPGSIVVAAMS